MSNKVIQTELFIKYLPTDLSRYTYKFIYRDVKVSFWRHKYNMRDKELIHNRYEKFVNNTKYILSASEQNIIKKIYDNIDKIHEEASTFPLSGWAWLDQILQIALFRALRR